MMKDFVDAKANIALHQLFMDTISCVGDIGKQMSGQPFERMKVIKEVVFFPSTNTLEITEVNKKMAVSKFRRFSILRDVKYSIFPKL